MACICKLFILHLLMPNHRNPMYTTAYEWYLSGLSLEQVAKKMSITRQSVFKAFKRRGLCLRGPDFRPVQEYRGKKFSLRNNGYYALTSSSRVYLHRYVWETEVGPIPPGFDIHHKDENRANNEITNLECISKSAHTKKHGFKNNQYTKKRQAGLLNSKRS